MNKIKEDICKCVYGKDGKQIGLCLRCAKREIEAFNRGKWWTYKYFMRRLNSFSNKYIK